MTDKIITIDGPSGVGKGTLARFLANKLQWTLLDSGSIYRALAYYCDIRGVDTNDKAQVALMAVSLPISFVSGETSTRVYVDQVDVTDLLRKETIGMLASKISAYPEVRQSLLELQRSFARQNGLVADGRDMGTIIFPNARLKLFLDASSHIRAQRRYQELTDSGVEIDYDVILQQVIQRDNRDRNRDVAPLVAASDAVIIDTSELDVLQVKNQALEILKKNAISY